MSLDIYLKGPAETVECRCSECDHVHERTCSPILYRANVAHNLNRMAKEARLYLYLWRPDEVNVTVAHELLVPLTTGLELLKRDATRFRALDALNGWGRWEDLVSCVRKYLAACRAHPDARVEVSR